jgi:hypothetical protein
MKTIPLLASAAVFVFANSAADPAHVLSVQKIWDGAPHNAFTDLIRYNGQWLCAFREGAAHVSDEGVIRIISSNDTTNWQSRAHVQIPHVDLRDPKICITPDGDLLLTTAGARRDQKPVSHQNYSWLRRDDQPWRGPVEIGDPNVWLWRVTWHKGTAYSVGYDTTGDKFVRLYHTERFMDSDQSAALHEHAALDLHRGNIASVGAVHSWGKGAFALFQRNCLRRRGGAERTRDYSGCQPR